MESSVSNSRKILEQHGGMPVKGCSISIDQIGNIFARRAGNNPSLPAIGMGSHIDTQPKGGKFDGN